MMENSNYPIGEYAMVKYLAAKAALPAGALNGGSKAINVVGRVGVVTGNRGTITVNYGTDTIVVPQIEDLYFVPMVQPPEVGSAMFPRYHQIGDKLGQYKLVEIHPGSRRWAENGRCYTVMHVIPHESDSRKDTMVLKCWGWPDDIEAQRWELQVVDKVRGVRP